MQITEEPEVQTPPAAFEADKYYDAKEVAARGVAAEQTLVQWRHLNKGPPYIKVGSRVIYPGADLLAWLDANRVEPLVA